MMDARTLMARAATQRSELADPIRNFYSDLKMTASLDGAPVYVTVFSKAVCLVPGRPAFELYATGSLYVFRLDRPDPAQLQAPDEHAFRINSRLTGFILDPKTFELMEGVENPVTGEWQETAGSVFEDQWIITPSGGYSALRPDYFYLEKAASAALKPRPHYVLGDDLIIMKEAIFHDEGPHQPRGNTLLWRSRLAEVLDPARPSATAAYDWHGMTFAWERAWLGFPTGDPTRLMLHAIGRKALRPEDGAPQIMKLVQQYFPERLSA